MSLPDYQIKVYHPDTGDLIRVFDTQSFADLRYSRTLNSVGSLVVTFAVTSDTLLNNFPLDALVEVERTSPVTGRLQVEETYLVRLTHRFRDGQQERIVIGAQSLNHLIMRRIVDPDDDPAQAGGYSTKAGAADAIMREYALEQMGASASPDRQFPGLDIPSVPGVGNNVGKRLRHENLLTVFQSIAEEARIDFHIRRTTGRNMELVFARRGQDRSKGRNYPFAPFVYLTPMRGNLRNPSLLLNRKEEQNFVYALGQGPGDSRIVIKMAGTGIADSPFNRIEFTADVRSNERGNSLSILSDAREALDEKKALTEFTFDLEGSMGGNVYRLNWDIGDTITAAWGDTEYDVRIVEVEVSLDASGETLSIKTENL